MDTGRHLRVIEGRNPRVEARRAWVTSRRRQTAIFVMTYLVASLYGTLAQLDSPFTLALVPSLGYVLATWVLSVMKDRWINRYAAAVESQRVVDISGSGPRARR